MTELESVQNEIDKIIISTKMLDKDLVIHILNNLTEEYEVILGWMESRLMLKENDPNKLTIEDVQDKLSGGYDRICERIAKYEDGTITDKIGMVANTKK